MIIEYKTIRKDEIASLPELGKQGWITSILIDSVIILYREKKRTRSEKKSSHFPEYLEFVSKYPRKEGVSSDAFIAKYAKIRDDGLHATVMESLERHKTAWKTSNLAAGRPEDDVAFIPHASTWINRKGWTDEVKSCFVPESKKKASEMEEMTAHIPEKSRKTVVAMAKQYLEDHPTKTLTPWLISQIFERYG